MGQYFALISNHLNRGKAGDLFLGTGIKVPKKLEVNWEKAPGRLGKLGACPRIRLSPT